MQKTTEHSWYYRRKIINSKFGVLHGISQFSNKVSFIQNIDTCDQKWAYFCLWSFGQTKRSWYGDNEMGSAQK